MTTVTQNPLLVTRPDRPPCGDDPMLWKERHASIGGSLGWVGSRPVTIFFSVLLGCFLLDLAYPVVMGALGAGGRPESRKSINFTMRGTSTALAVLGMLGVAASAAVSLTGEREQDTWISLATTLITPSEVVRAKQFGAVWSAQRVGVAVVIMWAVGLMLGAIHPLGVLASVLYVTLIAWLVATVGVFASSMAKNSTRALVATFVALFVFSTITGWPMILWGLLFYQPDLKVPWLQSASLPSSLTADSLMLTALVPLLAVQAFVGAVLTIATQRRLRATWGRS